MTVLWSRLGTLKMSNLTKILQTFSFFEYLGEFFFSFFENFNFCGLVMGFSTKRGNQLVISLFDII